MESSLAGGGRRGSVQLVRWTPSGAQPDWMTLSSTFARATSLWELSVSGKDAMKAMLAARVFQCGSSDAAAALWAAALSIVCDPRAAS